MDVSLLQQISALQTWNNPNNNRESNVMRSLFSSYLEEQLNSSQNKPVQLSQKGLFLNNDVELRVQQLRASMTNQVKVMPSPSKSFNVNTVTPLTKLKSQYDPFIQSAAKKYNVDPNLIASVIKHESNFNPNVKSHAGATGLMQLMPGTAKMLGVTNIYDPQQNINGGTKYLKQMLDRYNGDIKLALAAYNAGPGNVDRHGGIPPFKETQNYVPRVYNTYMESTLV